MSHPHTLLLNATYEPLKVISWQRAVTMTWLGKVEVLRSYESILRAVTISFQAPAVVRLVQYVRRHKVRLAFSRRNVFLRDDHRCQYCGEWFPANELTCDHVVPRSHGGGTSWENVVAACAPCNRRKGGRTPEQARMVLKTRPTRPHALPGALTKIGSDGAPEVWRDYLPSG